MQGISRLAKDLLVPQEGLCSMELVSSHFYLPHLSTMKFHLARDMQELFMHITKF